jgi:hypothetical protein
MDRDDRMGVRVGRGGEFRLMRREDGTHPSEEDALCGGKRWLVSMRHISWRARTKRKQRLLFLMDGFRGVPSAVRSCTLTRPGFSQSFGWVFKGCKSVFIHCQFTGPRLHARQINSTEADSKCMWTTREKGPRGTDLKHGFESEHAARLCHLFRKGPLERNLGIDAATSVLLRAFPVDIDRVQRVPPARRDSKVIRCCESARRAPTG